VCNLCEVKPIYIYDTLKLHTYQANLTLLLAMTLHSFLTNTNCNSVSGLIVFRLIEHCENNGSYVGSERSDLENDECEDLIQRLQALELVDGKSYLCTHAVYS